MERPLCLNVRVITKTVWVSEKLELLQYEQIEMNYRNDPMLSDRQVGANSADPDQTAPRGAV